MPFDQPTRNRLARFVADARTLLTAEFTRQLQHEYGLDPTSGAVTPLERLTHLDDTRRESARILRATLDHYLAGGGGRGVKAQQEALDRIVREQAFTVLNRLCALRMAEARGLLIESIARGYQSKGFQLYTRLAGPALGETGDAYRCYLFSLCDEFAVDLAVLFDRFSPQGRLFPGATALLHLLDLLNHPDLDALWAEDETIGWIYQYFNSREERKAMRDASQAPRNSRELAVRNQFFTPRYVVEFLTDNTLGRIWYEMTKGETSLKESCRYLVRRPSEIFLNEGETAPAPAQPAEDLSQEELLNQPVYIPHRPLKDPREITMLDPACGSMHFGLYAFDLFERIYEEAWEMDAHGTGMRGGDDASPDSQPAFAAPHAPTGSGQMGTGMRGDANLPDPTNPPAPHAPTGLGHTDTESGAMDAHSTGMRGDANLPQRAASPAPHAPTGLGQADTGSGAMDAHSTGMRGATNPPHPTNSPAPHAPTGLGHTDTESGAMDAHSTGMRGATNLPDPTNSPAPHAPTGLAADYATKEELRRDVPRLILEHNIHGIDIDPRAVQIAGLSLWLRAQRSWQAQGVKAQDRPPIRRSHIVCAEPMPGEAHMLEEFAATLQPPLLGQLVKVVFEKMKLAGEAGSLLKIEEELAGAVAEAKRQWLAGGKPEQGRLFPDDTPRQMGLELDLSGITDEAFWDRAEALVLDALHDYAEQAENGDSYQRRLFAGDSVRGFAFIDLCRKKYDVVLMNPPFGESAEIAKNYIITNFLNSKNDIYAAFVEEGIKRLLRHGLLGAITSRTGLFLTSFQKWREKVLLCDSSPILLADLGQGVLDTAVVETAAYVLETPLVPTQLIAFRLLLDKEKDIELAKSVCNLVANTSDNRIYSNPSSAFSCIPGAPFAYWINQRVRFVFQDFAAFDDEASGRGTRCGLGTLDDYRFLRLFWELPLKSEGWCTYYHGGIFSPFYDNFPLVVRWDDNGSEVKMFVEEKVGSASRKVQGEDKYFHTGFVFPRRTRGFSPKFMPPGGVFSTGGQAGFTDLKDLAWSIGILASSVCTFLISLSQGRTGDAAQFEVGLVKRIPWPANINSADRQRLGELTLRGYSLRATLGSVDLTARTFRLPALLFSIHKTLAASAHEWASYFDKLSWALEQIHTEIDETSLRLYRLNRADTVNLSASLSDGVSNAGDPTEFEVNSSDAAHNATSLVKSLIEYWVGCIFGRWDIRFATGERPPPELPDPFAPLPVCPPGMLQNTQGLPATPADVPAEYPLRISWPGILVDDEEHPEDIVRRVREVLQVIWPETHDAIEGEACEILGVRTLRDYFRKPAAFFADHLKRYSKSRRQAPIYWPLATPSGSYTLWLYYHRLSGQTLYTCVNDFVDPKIKRVSEAVSALRQQSNRTRAAEKELEQLADLALELQDFRTELLRIAAFWQPNLNDGVQITAAPLWRLFQHRPWQKRLKETWEKLAAGDYDWAHLAYSLWPDRVAAKCQTDKSLAIAHNLEHLYVEPPATAKKKARRTKTPPIEQDELFDDA